MLNSAVLYLEHAVEREPDNIAVEDANIKYTFAELQKISYSLANAISAISHKINTPIAVFLPKSADAVATFMAVLYCGDFYAPIDIKTPVERLKKIFDSLNPEVVITISSLIEKCSIAGIDKEKILCIDKILYEESPNKPEGYKAVIATDPACIIYTSGSTGEPKGVVLPHRRIFEEMEWAQAEFHFLPSDIRGNVVPFQYIPHLFDIFLGLYVGYKLVIVPEELYSFPDSLAAYFAEKKITSMICVSSVLCMLADKAKIENIKRLSFNCIIFVGEPMPIRQLNYMRKLLPDTRFIQIYGSTETVFSTQYEVDHLLEEDEQLPIGHTCLHTDVMLIDENNIQIKEQNKIGELYVRGNIALGYWNAPEATRKVFVQNPLNHNYPEYVYRTGDLAYINENGDFIFCGRKDNQIKHMGHRIELGEIETAAMKIQGLHRSCVLYDSDEKQLVMFYEADVIIPENELCSILSRQLPPHMMPQKYIHYEKFPQNQNGKIDRQKLATKLHVKSE